ncbi:hypothetical protein BUALT_Bualt06G0066100 [Buddleja alternifolia]|uniref:Uncharacterized protein n=1 Tax=Buddleja alternifolia TaxID=168488 RepID=A0AAV6XEQ0_9LAMI|nr:hypothetical protein BUALT_Bualt06G0066100 [Buddleja alternifolia]
MASNNLFVPSGSVREIRRDLPGNLTDDFCYVDIGLHPPGIWSNGWRQNFPPICLAPPTASIGYHFPPHSISSSIFSAFPSASHCLRDHGKCFLSRVYGARIILGPTILGQIPSIRDTLFPRDGEVYLDLLSRIGYIFFIFLSGVKMDPRTVLRTGIKSWTIEQSPQPQVQLPPEVRTEIRAEGMGKSGQTTLGELEEMMKQAHIHALQSEQSPEVRLEIENCIRELQHKNGEFSSILK